MKIEAVEAWTDHELIEHNTHECVEAVRRQLAASAVPLSADDVRGALALTTVIARYLAQRALGVED